MMRFDFLGAGARRAAACTRLAEQVVEACFERAWQRVAGRAAAMSPAEARGFVRARTADVLRESIGARDECQRVPNIEAVAMQVMVHRVLAHLAVDRSRARRLAA